MKHSAPKKGIIVKLMISSELSLKYHLILTKDDLESEMTIISS